MTSESKPDLPSPQKSYSEKKSGNWWYLLSGIMLLVFVYQWRGIDAFQFDFWRSSTDPEGAVIPTPLVMKGGDPYIRALMRTISASESNSPRPYSLLYGGEHFHDFSRHPDDCVPITVGPNTGDCTTAAGRYQMLTSTWLSKADEYHPQKHSLLFWSGYSFTPEDQDEVVYRWLSDSSAWGVDLSQLLREGEINEVLQILSPTWTSLGYGIETNSMSSLLPDIYDKVLQEELKTADGSPLPDHPAAEVKPPSTQTSLLDTPLRDVLPRLFGTY